MSIASCREILILILFLQDYHPNIIQLDSAPFEITRDGYALFEVGVTVEMKDGSVFRQERDLDFEQALSFEKLWKANQ